MDKVSFRKKQIDIMDEFMKSDQAQKEINDIYLQLFEDAGFIAAQSVGITMSIENEIPTFPIIKKCWNLGKNVYIPKTFNDYSMTFVQYTPDTELETSTFGVREPKNYKDNNLNPPELIITPGLAFSEDQKARLGFGAGYYDRYLSQYPTKTIALALSRQYYLKTQWPVYVLDKSVDQIISVSKDK
ncbi:5-formyltetrahydrofolate cyclo-ligase [Companilactobacillus allii]|uniref:5-formyltetrahydrofolate cyclo-ligase n=1 Tax=Companilactobacillus allii TaxID=1847728 RepID=A0A1P8Q433_9LACO|nr:5-formyltetrahydrofolate cyclo-ligase [Companilactobacillus allii]APX72559.1 5-formyltetrahydrofolate cyclo-ligase [Companilactobacillus allii]USQ69661.1 5-formyltetrahydrofolate cyclo-ligase [Companilactobacillus allii]